MSEGEAPVASRQDGRRLSDPYRMRHVPLISCKTSPLPIVSATIGAIEAAGQSVGNRKKDYVGGAIEIQIPHLLIYVNELQRADFHTTLLLLCPM